MNFLRKLYLFGGFLLLAGCQTPGYFITESNLPVAETRKAITAIIGAPRQVSLNGRELYSIYHDDQFKPLEEEAKIFFRLYTQVTILGARRPYEINVQVWQEKYEKQTRKFIKLRLDDSLSQKRAIDIKRAVAYSLEKQQAFDGDNPF